MSELPPIETTTQDEPTVSIGGLPLYVWVILAVVSAVPIGYLLSLDAALVSNWPGLLKAFAGFGVTLLEVLPQLIIRALTALAGPLVVLAILNAILTNDIKGRQGARMMGFYLINTLVAMTIGLALSGWLQPGRGGALSDDRALSRQESPRIIDTLSSQPTRPPEPPRTKTVRDLLIELVPRNIAQAFLDNNLAQIVVLTIALAVGLAMIRNEQRARGETSYLALLHVVTVGFELLMRVLMWVVTVVPLAVFGVVATSLAREGFELVVSLGWFIITVLLGLACQLVWYLLQLSTLARMSPRRFLRGARDVAATTFSTASTAATMPITLRALQTKLGVSRESSQLAACVGTNFNNDGTALYQAVAALFFAQALGTNLAFSDQLIIMLTTLVASVGAGGIPSGSFVTMPLIFAAVNISPEKLPILLTIDWFLDRCRTTSNVLGDMTVAVLLDRGKAAIDANRVVTQE